MPESKEIDPDDKHQYLIGGAILHLRDYNKVWERVKARLRDSSNQLSDLFVIQWQRTAVHLQFVATEMQELRERVAKLEAKLGVNK